MTRPRGALFVTICLGVAVMGATPASALGSLTVTPNSPLIDRQTVTVDGAGFGPSITVGFCQAIDDGSPSPSDCAGGFYELVATSESGEFSSALTARRLMFVPSLGRVVNCAVESCFIGAAEERDVAGTATFAPIAFAPEQPDGLIKRRNDGSIIGDNFYSDDGSGQSKRSAISAGGKWSFALRVENDGLTTDDIRVRAPAVASPFAVRYFVGPYNVTGYVTGAGLTYNDMAPGAIVPLAVQFSAEPGAPAGASSSVLVKSTSNTAGSSDTVRVTVVVPAAT
jgi:hypothetical protein